MTKPIENQLVEDFFKNIPTTVNERVKLPSKGKLYAPGQEIVELRALNYEDEKMLVQSFEGGSDPLNLILSRCIVSGPKIEDLLVIDKLYLIIRLRAISYGKTLGVEAKCQKCRKLNQLNFNLDQLEVIYFPDDYKEPIEVKLPVSDKLAKVRSPRVSDEEYMLTDKSSMDNVWRFVTEIAGITDLKFINNVLSDPRFPLKDMHVLVQAIGGGGYGINTMSQYNCEFCKAINLVALPLDANFFSPN